MKTHTLRGQFPEGTIKRLIIDDGRLTHAMRVTKFVVSTDPNLIPANCFAVLGYQGSFPSLWNWSDNNQIAWASTNGESQAALDAPFSLVDPQHLIIRDLYITGQVAGAGGSSPINYWIELEAIDVSEDRAILQLIKERSQSGLR